MRTRAALASVALGLATPVAAAVHDVDLTSIARVFLDQIGERRYLFSIVDSKAPPLVVLGEMLPEGCAPVRDATDAVRVVAGFVFDCERELTFDDVITIPWPIAGVVVLAHWYEGTEASAFFRGNGVAVPVRLEELRAGTGSVRRLTGRYFLLGVEHIVLGFDHLLFVLGLLVLVRGTAVLIKTITAFTIAHSITLGAAVAGWIPVDRAPVEAAIALSIILLAREIVVGQRGQGHLLQRRPWVVAFAFGLLHGLGFAGALGSMGLRTTDVPLALLGFNVGVEAGQVSFVAAVLALHYILRSAVRTPTRRLEPILGYALGGLAMLWLFDRLPAVFGMG